MQYVVEMFTDAVEVEGSVVDFSEFLLLVERQVGHDEYLIPSNGSTVCWRVPTYSKATKIARKFRKVESAYPDRGICVYIGPVDENGNPIMNSSMEIMMGVLKELLE